MSSQVLTPEQAAERIGVTSNYLAKLRISGNGPPYRRLSPRVIRYDLVDLEAWFDGRRERSTSEARAAA